jgi:hypothetical protein
LNLKSMDLKPFNKIIKCYIKVCFSQWDKIKINIIGFTDLK